MLTDNSLATRLVIEKIVVENFKSYLGRHTIGPFHRSFSAIVGPNGSGKSNVIDAVMFVLGSRAKRLRQSKLGELVHVSEGAEEIESCMVNIYFALAIDTDSSCEIVANSEFTVSRVAFKNSRNSYSINEQPCQQADVAALLMSHGVDLEHKRFLILQGEVELISQMKPKATSEHEEGLLEYLEDIIGTAHYAEKIEECAKTVDTANAGCSEKLLRTRHCEKELSLLVEEKEIAESYLTLENTITEKRSELFQVLKHQLECQMIKTGDALVTTNNALHREQEKNEHQVSTLESIEADLKERSVKYASVERELTELSKKMKRLESEDITLREKKTHFKKKLTNLSKTSADSEKKRGENERELANLSVEREKLEKQMIELSKSIESNQAELSKISASLKGQTVDLQADLEKRESELQPWKERQRAAQVGYEIATSAVNDFRKRIGTESEDLERMNADIELNGKELADSQDEKKGLIAQQKDLSKQSIKFVEQKQMAEAKQDQVGKEIAVLQSTIGEARESLLESRRGTGNQAINALVKDAKKIGGKIYGRLGDLGVIDGKYDVAISTAAPQLHYVVVDTTETGQKCVDYLKKNNLGRASFIILDKMKPCPSNSNGSKANAERLFDLITPKDPVFAPAFYFAINETLVAENLTIATQVAYDGPRRNRVVTLDGKLIDVAGTMSGGGKQLQRGAMRLRKSGGRSEDPVDSPTVTEEQIAELTALLEQKQEDQKILKSMIAEFAQSIASTAKELRQTELEIAKAEQIINSLPLQIRDLQSQYDAILLGRKEKQAANEKELSGLESKQKAAERSLEKIHKDMLPLLKQVEAVEEKIMEAGGIKFKVQKAKLDGMREQLELTETRLSKVIAEITVLGSTAKGTTNAPIKDDRIAKEELSIEKEIASIDEKLDEFTIEAVAIKTRMGELASVADEQKDIIADLKKSFDQHNRSLAKFRKHEFELKLKKEELEREHEEGQINITRYANSISSLKLNEYSKNKKETESIQQEIATLEGRLASIPNPNIAILKEYAKQKNLFDELDRELAQAEQHRQAIRSQFEQMRKARFEEFMSGLSVISQHLKQLYQLLTMGGNAELELVDSLDPFSEGVQFSVMPPKKSWKAISNLSGGEKTLASLSLSFALHAFRPTPIYIMDEIDAALDFRNVSIVANYIKQRTCRAQFIVISLRNDMFELADRLVGVYKVEQKTRTISIDPSRFAPLLAN